MTVLLVREMTEEAVHYVRWCHIIIHVIVTSCPHYQEHWLGDHGINKLKFWAKSHHQTSVESDHDLWQVLDKYLETIRNTVCIGWACVEAIFIGLLILISHIFVCMLWSPPRRWWSLSSCVTEKINHGNCIFIIPNKGRTLYLVSERAI